MKRKTHDLKTWPAYFEAVRAGVKTFEVRRDDRGFRVGDWLVLREWCPEQRAYTGDQLTRQVAYKVTGGMPGIRPGFCVLGLLEPPAAKLRAASGGAA